MELDQSQPGMLVVVLMCLLLTSQAEASCRGSCGACARRYGCMTPAWGKCCTQFFMHNGRKRSLGSASSSSQPNYDGMMESFGEYVRLKNGDWRMAKQAHRRPAISPSRYFERR